MALLTTTDCKLMLEAPMF